MAIQTSAMTIWSLECPLVFCDDLGAPSIPLSKEDRKATDVFCHPSQYLALKPEERSNVFLACVALSQQPEMVLSPQFPDQLRPIAKVNMVALLAFNQNGKEACIRVLITVVPQLKLFYSEVVRHPEVSTLSLMQELEPRLGPLLDPYRRFCDDPKAKEICQKYGF